MDAANDPSTGRPEHGGDLAAAERRFGPPPDGWLDLSTGINPVPYPDVSLSAEAMHRLPDDTRFVALRDAARTYYGAPDAAGIVAAGGTQLLIQLLPRLLSGKNVAIRGPTYGEHAATWRDSGRAAAEIDDWAALAEADVAVLVNPNNPDGQLAARSDLEDLAGKLAARGGTLIVDEAFGDLVPEASAIPLLAQYGNILVLRSFGKFFGLAGLRLGFCIAAQEFADRLERLLGAWAVSGPALEIGSRALSDGAWIAATRERLGAARERLDGVLAGAGLRVAGGTDLFRLVAAPRAGDLYAHLGRAGILVRAFAGQPSRLRFGLPGSDADFRRLETALAGFG